MPYIIITRPRYALAGREPEPATRTAVATLDEARTGANLAVLFAHKNYTLQPFADEALCLPESGGTIGPLPDGTVIEVREVDYVQLRAAAEVPFDDRSEQAILDAFNAR